MFKNSPMKNLTSHRNQAINLPMQINWLVSTRCESPPKSIIKQPWIENSKNTQVRFKNTHFMLIRLLPRKNVSKRVEVTINLMYLTHRELQFSRLLFPSRVIWSICFINKSNTKVIQETIKIVNGKMFKNFYVLTLVSIPSYHFPYNCSNGNQICQSYSVGYKPYKTMG